MLHVDEERLNAWLDFGRSGMTEAEYTQTGSHLARCAECTALLAEERALRERTSSILRDGAPRATARPSFEELAARSAVSAGGSVGATASKKPLDSRRRDRQRSTFVPLAWAASLLAALGAGWAASTLFDRQQVAIEMVAPATSPAADGRMTAPPQAAMESAEDQASIPVPPQAAAALPDADPAGSIAAGAEPTAAPSAQPTVSPSAARLSAPVEAEDAPVAARIDEPVAVGYQSQASVTQQEASPAEPVRTTFSAPDADAPAPLSLIGPAAESAATVAGTGAAGRTAAPPPAAARSAAPAPATAPMSDRMAESAQPGGIGWEIVDRAAAEARLGLPIAIHPTLVLLRIEVPTNSATETVRTVYALPNGSQLTVTQHHAVGVDATPTPSEGAATIRREGVILSGTAPIGPDSIATLLEAIR